MISRPYLYKMQRKVRSWEELHRGLVQQRSRQPRSVCLDMREQEPMLSISNGSSCAISVWSQRPQYEIVECLLKPSCYSIGSSVLTC